jgi:hypothetical protein
MKVTTTGAVTRMKKQPQTKICIITPGASVTDTTACA